jgi:methionine synthase II (cobalamin-independent)
VLAVLAPRREQRTWALSDAINKELNEFAGADCPVIQIEEPRIIGLHEPIEPRSL